MSNRDNAEDLLRWLENQGIEPEDGVPIMVAAIVAIIKSTLSDSEPAQALAAQRAAQDIVDGVAEGDELEPNE